MTEKDKELNRLYRKKAEIERQIEEVKSGESSISVNDVRYEVKTFAYRKEWRVVVNVPRTDYRCEGRKSYWLSFIMADSREELQKKLVSLIGDLVELNERLNDEESEPVASQEG